MAIFEDKSSNRTRFDDSLPLSCTFQQYRIINSHVEYIIKVQRGSNEENSWTIFKRYSAFETLDKELHAADFDIFLPGKKFLGNLDNKFILQRQEALRNYMNKVLSNLILSSSVPLKRFLDPENYSKTFQDTAFQYASMALRGKPNFHDIRPLPEIGWRYNKQYCKVKKFDARKDFILTWISEYGFNKCLNDKELQSTFKVLTELSHPYILSMLEGNCSAAGTLIIRSDCLNNSLRELIYEKSRFDSFIQKYKHRRERLIMPEDAISTISVQVLHALAFLHLKKIPYGNLHVGNIFFEDNVAKISDVENGIFGLPSLYKPFLVENRRIRSMQDIDVYSFGLVLYEMAFGERLQSFYCNSVPNDCYSGFRPVLELILANTIETKLPSVSEILRFEAFRIYSSNVVFDIEPTCRVNSHTKDLFQRCQETIENYVRNEQNELRKHRKVKQLQERVNVEEKTKSIRNVKSGNEDRKLKTASRSMKTNHSSKKETNNLNVHTPKEEACVTSSFCDAENVSVGSNKIECEDNKIQRAPSPESDDRHQFLQSIVSFNKQKLKKIDAPIK